MTKTLISAPWDRCTHKQVQFRRRLFSLMLLPGPMQAKLRYGNPVLSRLLGHRRRKRFRLYSTKPSQAPSPTRSSSTSMKDRGRLIHQWDLKDTVTASASLACSITIKDAPMAQNVLFVISDTPPSPGSRASIDGGARKAPVKKWLTRILAPPTLKPDCENEPQGDQ
mmetsp:Transcript_39624/g.97476  ORF Transcript_39624/g.97476 Transcript_39624/m.97476 type:complete len:167 (+) Transcript_39624:404-904(+)